MSLGMKPSHPSEAVSDLLPNAPRSAHTTEDGGKDVGTVADGAGS